MTLFDEELNWETYKFKNLASFISCRAIPMSMQYVEQTALSFAVEQVESYITV